MLDKSIFILLIKTYFNRLKVVIYLNLIINIMQLELYIYAFIFKTVIFIIWLIPLSRSFRKEVSLWEVIIAKHRVGT